MKFNRRQRFAVYGGLLMSTAGFMALVNGGSVGALTTAPTTGAAVAAGPTSSTTTSTTKSTTTTVGPTTTTTVGTKQVTLSGHATDTNNCTSVLNPDLLGTGPTATKVAVEYSASAFPQPHEGKPIKLTNSTLTVTIGASLIQTGVDAKVITDGFKIPTVTTAVITGSHTTEGTQTYSLSGTSIVHVVGGKAQPLVTTTKLKDTTWHPQNASDPVLFTQKSLKAVSTITLGTTVITQTLTCTPSGSSPFVALSAQGSAPPVTTGTTAPTGVTVAAATTTTTVAAAANTLPRTGANGAVLVIIAAALVDAGAALLLLTRRRRTI